ncbi:MAG TPA: MBL fold metallo-hydrolase [Stellaceae bacterium]|jgi:7,8-dihydropterin-6-yl-methyl-4-(beta-D-ribofuranosyl)aminobenzene 5'-phosphate synthase|nr:MBL fold metallo-hydrolase [Stellaceae bacterium]
MDIEATGATNFAPPLVDSLLVRVVVDSAFDRFVADATHPAVKIDHVRHIPGHERSTFAGEWGLSLHLESARAGACSQYLLDFGYTPEVLIRNFALLDLDPGRIDGLILSHGHLDHYGGLEGFVGRHRARMRPELELFTGGESAFAEKWIKRRDALPVSWGRLDRAALEAERVATVCCGRPHALAGPFTTGPIARASFERLLGNTLVEPAPAAAPEHFTEAERLGRLVPDEHPDEHATCYVVQGRGLVVISSCGHVGLINTVKSAMAVSGVGKLHAVLGGFHLGPAPTDYVDHTVAELKALSPDVVVPMHCSGVRFIEAMRREMPDRLVTTNIGTRFAFGV